MKYLVYICIFALVFSFGFINPPKAKALSWSQVNTDGFGDAANATAVRMYEFKDQIYATAGDYTPLIGGVGVWRYNGGVSWTQVNVKGFGSPFNVEAVMIPYNNALYVGTLNLNGFEIWKSTDGATWTQVGTAGFGDPDNLGVSGMAVFNGKLYLGSDNAVSGTKVYRLDTDDTWLHVNTDGFDGTNNNFETWSMDVFNGSLYAGTGNVAGGEIWSTANGTVWAKVSDNGFSDPVNVRISTLFHLGSYIYAGTLNAIVPPGPGATGTEIWRSANGTDWLQVNADGFGEAGNMWAGDQVAVINNTIYLGTRNETLGGQLFTSTNGTTWTPEGAPGFGSAENYAIYATTFNGNVMIGFSNLDTGAEIWSSGALSTLDFSPGSLSSGTVGLSYNVAFAIDSGTAPYIFTQSGDWPPGLSLSSDGVISGTPTRGGSYTFTITVLDSGNPTQMASRQYTLLIGAVLPETGIR